MKEKDILEEFDEFIDSMTDDEFVELVRSADKMPFTYVLLSEDDRIMLNRENVEQNISLEYSNVKINDEIFTNIIKNYNEDNNLINADDRLISYRIACYNEVA